MAGRCKKLSRLYLPGSTLIEIIVASVIILVSLLLFSVFLSQLLQARNINDEAKVLLLMPDLQHQSVHNIPFYPIDSSCSNCIIKIDQTGTVEQVTTIRGRVINKTDGHVLLNFQKSDGPYCTDSVFSYGQ